MSDLSHFWWQSGKSGPDPSQIGNALRFRGGQYLSRTPSTAGNRQTWTWSGWIKKADAPQPGTGNAYSRQMLFMADPSGSNGGFEFDTDRVSLFQFSGSFIYRTIGTPKLRDPSAWQHLFIVFNTTAVTPADRMQTWLNGVRVTAFDEANYVSQNWANHPVNSVTSHSIGNLPGAGTGTFNFRGYLAEVHFVDGQALAPTTFGEFNTDGVWVPKKVSGVTYGTNGFYLDFSDAANIGKDRSGNNNDFTATGFELTTPTSTNYDWVKDSPTHNLATWNPLNLLGGGQAQTSQESYSHANMYHDTGRQSPSTGFQTIRCDPGGKYGVEIFYESVTGHGTDFGALNFSGPTSAGRLDGGNYDTYLYYNGQSSYLGVSGTYWVQGATNSPQSITSGTYLGILFDRVNNTIRFYINGTLVVSGSLTAAGTQLPMFLSPTGATGSSTWVRTHIRCDNFRYPMDDDWTLATDAIADVAITKPSDHFTTILDTGANILTAAKAKFPNGLWWIKDRVGSNNHQLVDSVRGVSKTLRSNTSDGDQTYSAPSGNSVAWCWNLVPDRGNGFDMGTYVGNQADNRAIPHNLNKAPEFIVCKQTTGSSMSSWRIWHKSLNNINHFLELNNTGGQTNSNPNGAIFGGTAQTAPTASNFTIGSGVPINENGTTFVYYAWRSVPGYSSFGSYVGNGSSDGPFVYCGFRPAFIITKAYAGSDGTSSWFIRDTTREPYNVSYTAIAANTAQAENTSTGYYEMDILSNGFKIRINNTSINRSGDSYIFAAFAEHPFGGSNVSPAPAR